ncbi:hypothetical protein ACVNS2_07025 [Paenibacillus caseinilyticus]|nr:hypothetical protein [Paenibacillus mucilaginosus]
MRKVRREVSGTKAETARGAAGRSERGSALQGGETQAERAAAAGRRGDSAGMDMRRGRVENGGKAKIGEAAAGGGSGAGRRGNAAGMEAESGRIVGGREESGAAAVAGAAQAEGVSESDAGMDPAGRREESHAAAAGGASEAGRREHGAEMNAESSPGTGVRHSASAAKNGEAVAAMLAVLLGMAVLTAAHWWSSGDPASANPRLLKLASWVPGGLRIGPYAGKEAAALTVWLGSWLVLFLLLRRYDPPLKPWAYGFAAVFVLLLLLLWPPVYHAIYGWPA